MLQNSNGSQSTSGVNSGFHRLYGIEASEAAISLVKQPRRHRLSIHSNRTKAAICNLYAPPKDAAEAYQTAFQWDRCPASQGLAIQKPRPPTRQHDTIPSIEFITPIPNGLTSTRRGPIRKIARHPPACCLNKPTYLTPVVTNRWNKIYTFGSELSARMRRAALAGVGGHARGYP
ncbi:hypothetical protein CGCF413_v004342 [Colletotrichum fructicola]|nr:hypothetical protein CGCF413_v004342 [Colletotrichum fructicola]